MRTTCWQLIALLFSWSVAHAEPRVTEAVLGHDRIQKPGSYEIVKPSTVFAPNTAKIVCVFRLEGAGIGMNINSVWIAEDVGRAAPPNYKIAEKSLRLPFMNSGSVYLSKPTKGFPVGSYRLEIYIGSKLAKTLKFNVHTP